VFAAEACGALLITGPFLSVGANDRGGGEPERYCPSALMFFDVMSLDTDMGGPHAKVVADRNSTLAR